VVTHKEFAQYQQKMNKLKVASSAGKGKGKKEKKGKKSNGKQDPNSLHCYDCGKPGVKVGHDGCSQQLLFQIQL